MKEAETTVCPQCGTDNPANALRCGKCNTPLSTDLTTTGGAAEGWTAGSQAGVSSGVYRATYAVLEPGSVLGNRYEILQLLGEGGMGAVYKVRDREVDRLVALKVIRPELAVRPEILQRFKQELILARQVTHKNVIRIFDLGEADGVKFITMDFIEGKDLKSLLQERGKLPPDEAVKIIAQVCRALEAAHSEGVVHRDLKPQNIMVDAQGRVTVMDFGIARSVETPGMTQTGALIGTPEYMSPEQAKGEHADARSDLFTLGIIFYELLTGNTPYRADSAYAMLLKRTTERAKPPMEVDPSIPQKVSDVVMKCLEIDLNRRYSSAREILDDLGVGDTRVITQIIERPRGPLEIYGKWVGAALIVLLGVSAFLLRDKFLSKPAKNHPPVAVLLADFTNGTNDPVFDGTLEPMLGVALEGAPFISLYNRGAAHREAAKLEPGATKLDEKLARLVAQRDGVSVVVPGAIVPDGSGYKVSVEAVDATTGKTIVKEEKTVAGKEYVLNAAGELASGIRKALGDTTPISAQREAAETFTAGSLEAAHAYAEAQNSNYQGKWDEAIKEYQHAVQLDPNLGRAYAGLGAAYANMGQRQESEKYYQMAMAKIDRMTEREKYRTRGGYYLMRGEPQKAIEEYTSLVNQYPSDTAGYANLALAYFYTRNMAKALEEGRKAIEISPKNVVQRNNLALYALYAGDFDTAEKEAQNVLDLNPSFEKGMAALGLAQLGQGKNADAAATYEKLAGLSARGAAMASSGLADLALYEGRLADAAGILEKGIAGDEATNNKEDAADKLATLGLTDLSLGRTAAALEASQKALAGSKEESVVYRAARVYIGAGQEAKAKPLIAELGARLSSDPQAYAKLLEGEAQLKKGSERDAIQTFQTAQKIADSWLGHFDLGRAYLDAGAFTEASSEFDLCLKRKGEATAVFLDDVPSYHDLPPVYYYQGRAQEGLKSPGAAESYKTFLAIKEKGAGDPLVADARRRLDSR